ncbi:hypothetical protein Aduo_010814 [Ancylostoma duodenale]
MVRVGQVSTANTYVFGAASICLNSLLILVIYFRSLKVIGSFKYMMIVSTVFDILYSAVYILASPTFAAVEEMSSLLIVKGGLEMPMHFRRVTLVLFIILLCQSIVTPPCLFVFRYLQMCKSNFLANNYGHLKFLLIIPVLMSGTASLMLCYASWPTEFDLKFFKDIAYEINVKRTTDFLVASLEKKGDIWVQLQSYAMVAVSIYLVFLMLITLGIMIYCTRSIIQAVKKNVSSKLRHLQVEVYRSLIAQFTVPFLLIHLPFYLCVLAPLVRLRTGVVSDYLPFLFAWSPAINPIVVLYFVREYRRYLLSILWPRREENSTASAFYSSCKRSRAIAGARNIRSRQQ